MDIQSTYWVIYIMDFKCTDYLMEMTSYIFKYIHCICKYMDIYSKYMVIYIMDFNCKDYLMDMTYNTFKYLFVIPRHT